MPRQGARRKQKARAQAAGGAKEKRKKGAQRRETEAASPASAVPTHKQVRSGVATDFEAALAAPGETSEKLFELANKPAVRLLVGGSAVEVVQDHSTTEHSGGVVWETAFFLARYLEQHVLPGQEGLKIIELGAGCGLLGLALTRLGHDVVLTEQAIALPNLRTNVKAAAAAAEELPAKKKRRLQIGTAKALGLAWGEKAELEAVKKRGPFDLIVASDVVFSTTFVEPLLKTIKALMDHALLHEKRPECWLCLQRRDPDAHDFLMAKAPKWFKVKELSFEGLEGFEAAAELECLLLRFRRKVATASPEVDAAEDVAGKRPSKRKANL